MPLVFSYGSNMDAPAMALRCPGAKPLGLARLARHRRAVMREGYLTATRDPSREIVGMLWDVPQADMGALDRYEEVHKGLYRKALQMVIGETGARRAIVYFGANDGPGTLKPDYFAAVLGAAKAAGLPEAALREIAALGTVGGRRHGPLPPLRGKVSGEA